MYDDRGSEPFEEITRLEEYYPTRTEAGILREAAKPIGAFVWPRPVVVEYGAGAAVKTALLLAALDRPAEYLAVDLAGDFMSSSVARLGSQFPGLKVRLRVADFTRDFDLPDGLGAAPRLGFFPGSTFGNLSEAFTRLAELGGWDVAELWTDADRLFAVFGLVAAEPAQGS